VLQVFFGESSSSKLHLPKFRAHLQALHTNIVAAEFRHYDESGRGYISGTDFARSIVTPADVRRVDHLLDKVRELCVAVCVGVCKRWLLYVQVLACGPLRAKGRGGIKGGSVP
jgi:hypothetical protein